MNPIAVDRIFVGKDSDTVTHERFNMNPRNKLKIETIRIASLPFGQKKNPTAENVAIKVVNLKVGRRLKMKHKIIDMILPMVIGIAEIVI